MESKGKGKMILEFLETNENKAFARWLVPEFVIVWVMLIFVVGVSYHVVCSAIRGDSVRWTG